MINDIFRMKLSKNQMIDSTSMRGSSYFVRKFDYNDHYVFTFLCKEDKYKFLEMNVPWSLKVDKKQILSIENYSFQRIYIFGDHALLSFKSEEDRTKFMMEII